MNRNVLKKLGYNVIQERLAECAVSQMGKARCRQIRPMTDFASVQTALALTGEAERALGLLGRNPVDAFPDVRPSLKRAPVTVSLGQSELLRIARAHRAVRLCKEALSNESIADGLKALGEELQPLRMVEEEIFRCLISEDEVSDSASPKLHSLRQAIKRQHEKVREKIGEIQRSAASKGILQDPIITMRNGRYVLPVKQESKGQLPGLLHDQSSSGATLFVEPSAVVEIGNEIIRLEGEEREEIARILSELTSLVAPGAAELSQSLEKMAAIDLLFAKARLAGKMRAVPPKLNDEKYLRIVAGRHPLLNPDQVVPVDIWLGKDFQTLIITGPNTGGKTVTLKMVGLFAAMAQSGLFLPAAAGTEMPVYDNIFADIGDEQSIEQSLSTFSAHMKTIVGILQNADEDSLVLLDELGAGTDPIEGAALAMAVLDDLQKRRCSTLASTHYSELKAFALTHDGIENASMEFDVQTLRPTYRLFVGIPGKSNAFEISRKLGLPKRIIADAQKRLDGEDMRFEDVISSAESQRRIAEEERKQAELARQELYQMREKTAKEQQKWEKQKEQILEKARAEARKTVESAKSEAEGIVRELRRSLREENGTSNRDRAVQGARDALRGMDAKTAKQEPVLSDKFEGKAPESVKPGDDVYLVKLDQNATVIEQSNAREAYVQAGIIKMNVKLKDLRLLRRGEQVAQKSVSTRKYASQQFVSLELDLRGERVEDALLEAERYLDDASLAGLQEVTIIHGKGTGALRSALHEQLRREPGVKSFRLGAYGEGDVGVTVVQLKG